MGRVLTHDERNTLIRLLMDLTNQVANSVEYPYDPERLRLLLKAVSEGHLDKISGFFPSEIFASDFIKNLAEHLALRGGERLIVEEDVVPSNFRVKDLEFIPVLESGDRDIYGDMLRRRAAHCNANFGLVDGKYILEHQDEIPFQLCESNTAIVLPGTLLRTSRLTRLHPSGCQVIATLWWNRDNGRWHSSCTALERGWRDAYLVRCKQSAPYR